MDSLLPTRVLQLAELSGDASQFECSEVQDAALLVHRAIGPGLEPLFYSRALAIELAAREIAYERDCWFDLRFRGASLGRVHFDLLLPQVGVSVVSNVRIPEAEVLRMSATLRVARRPFGLVLNFGGEELQSRRIGAELWD